MPGVNEVIVNCTGLPSQIIESDAIILISGPPKYIVIDSGPDFRQQMLRDDATHLDAIVFTAGVGENDMLTRKLVSKEMDFLGIQLDDAKNESRKKGIQEINSPESLVKVLVIPTNEEWVIAHDTLSLTSK